MNAGKRVILGILFMTSFFSLLLVVNLLVSEYSDNQRLDLVELEGLESVEIINTLASHRASRTSIYIYIIPLVGFSGLIAGALVYYLLDEKKQRVVDLARASTKSLLKLLEPGERKIVEKLVSEGGKVSQSEITYLKGFTKVKAHRLVKKLAERGVVSKEVLGKKRLIKLDKSIFEFLKE